MRIPGLFVLLILITAGCDRTESYLDVFREQHAALEETSRALAKVTDTASMEAAKDQLRECYQRSEAVARRAKAMPKPNPEVRDRLEEEAGKMKRAVDTFLAQLKRVQALPGGPEFLQEVLILKRAEP